VTCYLCRVDGAIASCLERLRSIAISILEVEEVKDTAWFVYDAHNGLNMAAGSRNEEAVLGHGVRDDFNHPFTPYDVQLQFMKVAYDVLDQGDGQVGILESPTGTVCRYLRKRTPAIFIISRPSALCDRC
jgi:hypothetical protein